MSRTIVKSVKSIKSRKFRLSNFELDPLTVLKYRLEIRQNVVIEAEKTVEQAKKKNDFKIKINYYIDKLNEEKKVLENLKEDIQNIQKQREIRTRSNRLVRQPVVYKGEQGVPGSTKVKGKRCDRYDSNY
jgi:hypothetical protein